MLGWSWLLLRSGSRGYGIFRVVVVRPRGRCQVAGNTTVVRGMILAQRISERVYANG